MLKEVSATFNFFLLNSEFPFDTKVISSNQMEELAAKCMIEFVVGVL